ncbi:SHC SH2 domain-binding protein 1 [Nephila pilipes]|uniref:SHC SH2 domain-binding protein 1 n=1 Tax=Nephila pilipes TaxID=299642 RepID=A0A8X6NSK8_NEPPI|nr:SHC SH2 domain-binding protein 1 [Nephila pilipes]
MCLVDYITSVVEPVGWKAVWRSTKETSTLDFEYDFIAEVVNVSLIKLEAEIFVKSIIIADLNPSDMENIKEKLDVENSRYVPLTELYVGSEDDYEGFFEKTAIAIEHIRFFYKHICRPWDKEEDTVYSEEVLKSRLQLYFDMKNNILPKTMISKIKSVLKEGFRIYKELENLYSDMHVSDSEAEINEEDLMHSVALRKKLGKLQAKMEMLENPIIRSFVTKKYSPTKALRKQPKSSPVTYMVAKQFSKDIVEKLLSFEITSILEFQHNPESAFKYSSAGDKIFIFPGVYQCDTLGWIEGEISVQGVGLNSDIVLEATGNSEVFLNCCAEKIKVENVSFMAKSGLLSAIVVHHGEIELKNCIIDSNKADIGILLLSGSEALIENSVICNSCEDGIQMRSMSSLKMKSTKIMFSMRHGIQIDAESGPSPDSFTDINVKSSRITENGGYGIYLNNVPIADISLQRPIGDFNVLGLFPWLKHQIDDTVMENNGLNGIGIFSSCKKRNDSISDSTLQVLSNHTTREDLNYSALSDLLNEVNLSISNLDSN